MYFNRVFNDCSHADRLTDTCMTWIFFPYPFIFLPREKETVCGLGWKTQPWTMMVAISFRPFTNIFTLPFSLLIYYYIEKKLLDWMSFWSAFKACKVGVKAHCHSLDYFEDLPSVCVSRMKITKQSKDLWPIEIIDECEKDIRDSRHFPVNHERISFLPIIHSSICMYYSRISNDRTVHGEKLVKYM